MDTLLAPGFLGIVVQTIGAVIVALITHRVSSRVKPQPKKSSARSNPPQNTLLGWVAAGVAAAVTFFVIGGIYRLIVPPTGAPSTQVSNANRPSNENTPPKDNKPIVRITSPESQASSVYDFKSDATGAAYLRVAGTSENVFSDNSLRIYVFVHSVKPSVDRGWWFQDYSEPNQKNEWEVSKVWFGSKTHPVIQGNVYDIQAIVAKSGLLDSLKKTPYVESLRSLEPLSSSEIRVTVGAVSRNE